jgi:LuxR family maltose regulon positive regulatory protein
MLGDAQLAFDLEPPGSAWRPAAALLLGCARSLNGLRREAVWPLELAASLAEQLQPSTAYFALAQRALVAAEEDDWEVAQRCADDSVRLMRQSRLERAAPSVLTHVVAAWTAVHRGDREVALAHADEALRLDRTAPITVAWSAAQASIALARVLALLGDTERARSRLEAARRQLARLVSEGTLREQLDSVHKSLFVLGGEPSLAVPTVSPAELRVLEQLPTHLSLTEIAAELHVSRNTVKSHVASLYRKLQASGRTEAVRRAREAGLLRR